MARRLTLIASLALLVAAFAAAPAEALKIRNLDGPAVGLPGSEQHLRAGLQAGAGDALHDRLRAPMAPASGGYAKSAKLNNSADRKGEDILRCDSFSHYACGRDFTFWLRRVDFIGGCWTAGENIAWGSGDLGSARSVFRAWMHSSGHRENILAGDYSQLGVSLRIGTLEGTRGARVWVQHFGDRC